MLAALLIIVDLVDLQEDPLELGLLAVLVVAQL
jgi:hypothetical protein